MNAVITRLHPVYLFGIAVVIFLMALQLYTQYESNARAERIAGEINARLAECNK